MVTIVKNTDQQIGKAIAYELVSLLRSGRRKTTLSVHIHAFEQM